MTSRKNVWRGKLGALQFRRETKRYSDGTPYGCDVLYIRVKGKFCATVERFDWPGYPNGKTLCLLLGTYSAESPVSAARTIRNRYLKES